MLDIIEKARLLAKEMIENYPQDPYSLWNHFEEVERWAIYLQKINPEVDKEIILLSVWLHDIGHYPVDENNDHAIIGETRARDFLEKEGYDKEKTKKVLHCVRSHRNKDVSPSTIEAKIICFADTASHITSSENVYFDILKRKKYYNFNYDVFGKMERDFRDLDFFPKIKKQLKPLYKAWEKVLKEYNRLKIE